MEQTDDPVKNRHCGLQEEENKNFSRNSVINWLLHKNEGGKMLVAHNQI